MSHGSQAKPVDLPEKRRLWRWSAVTDRMPSLLGWIILATVVAGPWLFPVLFGRPEGAPAIMLLRPTFRENPQLVWHFFLSTYFGGRFLLILIVAAAAGTLLGTVLGVAAGYFGTSQVDRGIAYVSVFPSVLIAVLIAGVATQAGVPLFVSLLAAATIRFFEYTRDRTAELRSRAFTRYAQAIGESAVEQTYRHVVGNLRIGFRSRFLTLVVDLLVLTANLSFLRLSIPRFDATRSLLDALTWEWGAMLSAARSDFIKGIYAPSIWPAIFLLTTILLVRRLAKDRMP